MGHQDLRDWIELVDAMGDLRRISGARWEDEIGPITEIAQHREDGPCVLFDDIPGVPRGYRLVSNALGSLRRAALTLHMEPRPTAMDLVKAWRERSRRLQPIPPKVVTEGPVLENVLVGDRINMLTFPTPKWHEHDGGRYIGTGSVDITRDPEGGWVNLGTYRVMVHDERTLGFYISPGKHGRIHRDQTFKAGKTMKLAVSFGQDPLLFMAGSIEVPFGQSEYDWAGAVRGAPVEVILGPDTGLPIPAHAEVVIEGEAVPTERREEGPFGEWTGYYASDVRPEPVMRVTRLMHRNDPILLGSPPGKPPSELTAYRSVMRSALLWDQMEAAGVPGIQAVWCHPAGGTRLFNVVAIRQMFAGHAKQAGAVATQCRAGAYLGRYTIVVDEDVDPTDLYDVVWAMSTRVDPERDLDILRRCWSGPLDPIIPLEEKGFNSRAIIDATRPYEWRDKFPAVAEASPEVRRRTLEKWGRLLFGGGGTERAGRA
jgi:4-hydroxy-3-polyprenylbenzoate decarboxylase